MKNIIAFIFIAMLIVIVTLSMGGCAPARVLYHELPTEQSESALVKQGSILNKKPIIGKGYELIVYGKIETKVTKPDGTIVEIKTMKSSFLEKMLGWMTILKPNSVGVGK